ncbi:MAG TPA: MFS transporter [Terriglobales bacterium]|nr:MFS transporter [Terriglobales bacterium]
MKPGTSRVRWLLVFWIFILSAIAFLDRVNISIAGTQIASQFQLSNVQLGWIFSAFLAGYAFAQAPAGRFADRVGPRRVLAAGVIWWGLFTALTAAIPLGVAHALVVFIVLRFLLGAGEAVVYPASNQFVSRWIPSQERGMANGWIFAGVGAGAGLSPPLITFIMLNHGWRWSFWMCALLGLAAGLVWLVIARDRPSQHSGVSKEELSFIESGLTVSTDNKDGQLIPWRTVLASKDVLAVTLSYFCFGYVAWIFFAWFYIYLAKVRQLDLKASAVYGMLPFVGMAVGCLLGGALSDRLTQRFGPRVGRCILSAIAVTVTAIFLAVGSSAAEARIASVVLAGGAGTLYISQSAFWSVAADIGGASSGSVSGFMNMGAQIGGMVTASLTPWIAARFGWTMSFLFAAALCLVGAAAWLMVDPNQALAVVSETGKSESRSTTSHPRIAVETRTH